MFTFWRKLMAELDDLKAAVTALTTAVSDAATEMKAVADALVALQGQTVINPADVEAAAQSIAAQAAALENAVAATKTEAGV
jgi:predicted  nucleic acid-binding Zn-ribbon protein